MARVQANLIEWAKKAAVDVLIHNMHGPCCGLPRTAGWGYPEPYTRDLLIAGLGTFVSDDKRLSLSLRQVLETLAKNQSPLGHIPSLVHDPDDRGASDTTPLFLMILAMYRYHAGDQQFLEEAAQKSRIWMDYRSPSDRVIVAQFPTTDWRDEQWVLGFGLYVNTLVYAYLRLFGDHAKANQLASLMHRFTITGDAKHRHVHEGLAVRHKPYYAFWSYKIYSSERFDLLGNSLAILTGIATRSRANNIISWVEAECEALRARGDLAVDMPPNFFPFVQPGDPEWSARYEKHNPPGMYHNGGVWPFVCGFYVAALVAARRMRLARRKLETLAELVHSARNEDLPFGFNEYLCAQDGVPLGHDWQTWSAAMFLYAAACVERETTPFFDEVRDFHGK